MEESTLGLTVVLLVVIFSVTYFNRLHKVLKFNHFQTTVQQVNTKIPKSTKEEKVTVQEGEGYGMLL
jgi:hypothetical protein